MSTLHKENDAVLPRGGSLAYSYRSANLPHISSTCSSRPSCDRSDASSITLLSDIDEMSDADDELDCGFWGSRASFDQARKVKYSHKKKSSHRSIYTFCCFWSAVSICTLGAIGAFFAADFVFTQFGMGTGKVNWMVYGNAGRQSTNYQMHFCLTSPDRQVPGPQTWRYIRPDRISGCTTEVVTLTATSNEHWKLRLDDENHFGGGIPVNAA